jgi:uncharacterized protein YjbI with pentapeptide repeats
MRSIPHEQIKQHILSIGAKHVDFSYLNLEGIDLSHFDLSGSKIHQANLDNANLSSANLTECSIINSSFKGANLNNAILDRAQMQGCEFNNSTMIKASLRQVSVRMCRFEKSILHEANFFKGDLQARNQANLFNSDLQAPEEYSSDDEETVYYPNLFIGADLSGANLTKACMNRTALQGAVLTSSVIKECSFHKAVYDIRTKWPEQFQPQLAGAVRSLIPATEDLMGKIKNTLYVVATLLSLLIGYWIGTYWIKGVFGSVIGFFGGMIALNAFVYLSFELAETLLLEK